MSWGMPPQTLAINGVPAGACRCSKVVSLAVEDCGSWAGGGLFVAVFFDEFACRAWHDEVVAVVAWFLHVFLLWA